jgi:hypothetical protein
MKRWAAALFAEFSSIVERERAAGLPTTPFLDALDGAPLAQARAQVNFVGGVVRPLWVALDTVVGGALDEQLARVAVRGLDEQSNARNCALRCR